MPTHSPSAKRSLLWQWAPCVPGPTVAAAQWLLVLIMVTTSLTSSHASNVQSDPLACDEVACARPIPSPTALLQLSIRRETDHMPEDIEFPLIPKPQTVKRLPGGPWSLQSFFLDYDDGSESALLDTAKHLYVTSHAIPVFLDKGALPDESQSMTVRIRMDHKKGGHKEKYKLRTFEDGVELSASTEQGLFRGLMTLRQLVTKEANHWQIPSVEIEDWPAMEWRGLMLDVARHFFPANEVKDFLTVMSLFKLNRFHWHLSDDQGWRLPIRSWPNLVKTGAWRDGSPVNQNDNDLGKMDGEKHGGAYTQEEVADIVQHASLLFIEIVPEIDEPGHVQAAVAAYPELGNTDISGWQAPHVANRFGKRTDQATLAPNDKTFQFLRDVINAEADMIPSRYVHLGGDEVNVMQWSLSDNARHFLHDKKSSVDHAAGLQGVAAYFHQLTARHVLGRGRRPVVWEEAADPNLHLPTESIVMLWKLWGDDRQELRYRVEDLTEEGHDVVLAPFHWTYLDFPQTEDGGDFPNPMGTGSVALDTVYTLPLPKPRGTGRVLGGQAQLWSEYIRSKPNLDHNAWPRGCALAERLWTGGDTRSGTIENFHERLAPRLVELGSMGVHYHPVDGMSRV